ncbi:MAG TPA: hypothetical protein ENI92_01945, partial [Bacteroidetes bacterium]|nr:hypothetical protein [Bacteroidota bacterium]
MSSPPADTPAAVPFGDRLPPPPRDTRQPASVRRLGRFAYGLRAGWLHLTHRRTTPPLPLPPEHVGRLLAVQCERLGDLVLAEPTLRALRLHYPDAERVLIAQPYAAELFAGTGWGEFRPPKALEELRGEAPFDLVVDLTGRVETRIARTLARARIPFRLGYDRGGRGVFHTASLPWPEITLPMREVYYRLAAALGAEAGDTIPRLPRGEQRLARGREAWRAQGLRDPVLLLPGAFFPEQCWE